MTFDTAFDRVMGHEAGYVNDPHDPGGETKWGISKRSYHFAADCRAIGLHDTLEELAASRTWMDTADCWQFAVWGRGLVTIREGR